MLTQRGLATAVGFSAAEHHCIIQASFTGTSCPRLLSNFGRDIWNRSLKHASVPAALSTFSKSVLVTRKPIGMLVCRILRRISILIAELLEQSNLTLQCGTRREPVCGSKLPASKYRSRTFRTSRSLSSIGRQIK